MLRALALLVLLTCLGRASAELQISVFDPLIKVFPDSTFSLTSPYKAETAKGEVASWLVVMRADERTPLNIRASALRGPKGSKIEVRIRQVGYVPVDRPTQQPSRDQLRKPPFDYPDPLLPELPSEVAAHRATGLWIDAEIPAKAAAGCYKGSVTVNGQQVMIEAEVYDVTVGPSRLWVTNWFGLHSQHLPEVGNSYDLLSKYARNMAEHRQNMAIINPLNLVKVTGKSGFDFSEFGKWVDIFIREGVIGRIEGGHIGGREGGWDSQFVVRIKDKEGIRNVAPASPEADAFYSSFLPALTSYLRSRGWLGIYTQHIADEPIRSNLETYRQMSALVRKYAPELKIVEATHTKDLAGSIDIWVPQLNYWADDYEYYKGRQIAGDEVWFYTCVFPQGEYANRFIEQPLIKTRLLHWMNFRYGATGYLHWGYNQWGRVKDPYTELTPPHGGPPYLPAGDSWIVYPGKEGPIDSIRWEAMRDGIADHELLSMLAERSRTQAQSIAGRLIRSFDTYDTSIEAFRSARRDLLRLLSRS